MSGQLKNCWEIIQCGREKNGIKVHELGECIASAKGLGHSCWMIAGSLCSGNRQGIVAQEKRDCVKCEVYQLYNRISGTLKGRLEFECQEEQRQYQEILLHRI